MLDTFLDKLGGFFNRRFLVTYWGPALIGSVLFAGLIAAQPGFSSVFIWWTHQTGTEQALLGAGAILFVTVAALVLEALTTPIVRLYEGYWPQWLQLTRRLSARQQRMLDRLEERLNTSGAARKQTQESIETIQTQLAGLLQHHLDQRHKQQQDTALPAAPAQAKPPTVSTEEERLLEQQQQQLKAFLVDQERAFASTYYARYYDFPRDGAIKPTRLGNLLSAAEEYPYQLYKLEAILWWPRLAPLLPGKFRRQIDATLGPLVALLNLSVVLGLFALGGVSLLFNSHLWWVSIFVVGIGLALAWVCYCGALNQARDYGDMIRVSFDLYRHEIFKQLHVPVPDSLAKEHELWEALNRWLYFYRPPWRHDAVSKDSQLAYPFYFDTRQAPAAQSNSGEMATSQQLSSAVNNNEG